jgi:hypothetical protein
MLSHQDNNLSSAQALTASAASEDYVDLGADGDGWAGLQVVVSSPTILDSAGDAATLTISIESDTDAGFATNLKKHLLTDAIPESELTAGIIAKIPLPFGIQRYVRLDYDVGVENFTSGTISARVARPDNDNLNS